MEAKKRTLIPPVLPLLEQLRDDAPEGYSPPTLKPEVPENHPRTSA